MIMLLSSEGALPSLQGPLVIPGNRRNPAAVVRLCCRAPHLTFFAATRPLYTACAGAGGGGGSGSQSLLFIADHPAMSAALGFTEPGFGNPLFAPLGSEKVGS